MRHVTSVLAYESIRVYLPQSMLRVAFRDDEDALSTTLAAPPAMARIAGVSSRIRNQILQWHARERTNSRVKARCGCSSRHVIVLSAHRMVTGTQIC